MLKSSFKVIENIKNEYETLSKEAILFTQKLIEDFEYHTQELCVTETEMKAHLSNEIDRARAVLGVPIFKQLLNFENREYFEEFYNAYFEKLKENVSPDLEEHISKSIEIYHGYAKEELIEVEKIINTDENAIEDGNMRVIKLWTFKKYFNFLKEQAKSPQLKPKSKIFWKGENDTEFVQLIYSLIESNRIEYNGTKTEVIADLASFLNFDISKNWEKLLSKSINESNADYEPKIFKNLLDAFKRIKQQAIEKNSKK